jgi:hypothetical protein
VVAAGDVVMSDAGQTTVNDPAQFFRQCVKCFRGGTPRPVYTRPGSRDTAFDDASVAKVRALYK